MASTEESIYNRLASAPQHHPSNVSLFADWNMQAGDVVQVKSDDSVYDVPVYSMKLKWNGASKIDVESTGNPEREPLPALKRREYSSNSSNYAAQKSYGGGLGSALEKIANINGIMYAAGLQIDPVSGVLMYASEHGSDYALGSSFKVQSDAITSEVTRATNAEGELSSSIIQTANRIALKVSKGDVATQLSVECGNVTVSGGNLVVSGYITSQGLITTMGQFNGSIYASGSIGTPSSMSAKSITLDDESLTSYVLSFMQGTALYTIAADSNINLTHSHSISFSVSGGTVTATLGNEQAEAGTANFNIADTTYYKNGVASAWTNAYNTVRINNNKAPGAGNKTINLGSGQSVEVYAQAKSNANASIWTTVGTVTVNAPTYTLGTLSITSNGTYNAPTYGYTGFSYVSVNVPSGATVTSAYVSQFIASNVVAVSGGYRVTGTIYLKVEFSDGTSSTYGPYTKQDTYYND